MGFWTHSECLQFLVFLWIMLYKLNNWICSLLMKGLDNQQQASKLSCLSKVSQWRITLLVSPTDACYSVKKKISFEEMFTGVLEWTWPFVLTSQLIFVKRMWNLPTPVCQYRWSFDLLSEKRRPPLWVLMASYLGTDDLLSEYWWPPFWEQISSYLRTFAPVWEQFKQLNA